MQIAAELERISDHTEYLKKLADGFLITGNGTVGHALKVAATDIEKAAAAIAEKNQENSSNVE